MEDGGCVSMTGTFSRNSPIIVTRQNISQRRAAHLAASSSYRIRLGKGNRVKAQNHRSEKRRVRMPATFVQAMTVGG